MSAKHHQGAGCVPSPAICKKRGFVGESEFGLVETLTEKIAEIILTEFAVPWVKVVLNKRGAIRGAEGVGIIIERGKKG